MSTDHQLPLGVGLHYGVKASEYHADPCETPSLSSGTARTILTKSLAAAHREHPRLGGVKRSRTQAMDRGSLVHAILAECPDDFEIGIYDNYLSKAAKEWRDAVLESGKNAALEKDLDRAHKIVASIRKNVCNGGVTSDPFAAHGKSEVTVIWKEGDIFCRALPDRLLIHPDGGVDVYDWKVTNDISDDAISRSISKWGYHIQEAHYRRGLSATLPASAGPVSWVFVFVLDAEPFTVRRVCLSAEYLAIGRQDVSQAIRLWQHALATNEWPDGSEQTLHLEPPPWLFDDEISDSITAAA